MGVAIHDYFARFSPLIYVWTPLKTDVQQLLQKCNNLYNYSIQFSACVHLNVSATRKKEFTNAWK